jgi:hypothetical protein
MKYIDMGKKGRNKAPWLPHEHGREAMQGHIVEHEFVHVLQGAAGSEGDQLHEGEQEENDDIDDNEDGNRVALFHPVFEVRFEGGSVHTGKLRKKCAPARIRGRKARKAARGDNSQKNM